MIPGYLNQIHSMTRRWSHLGTRELKNGTRLIGNTPKINKDSYLHELYNSLTNEEVESIEAKLDKKLPSGLKEFFLKHNGCNLFHSLTGIYGLKKFESRSDPEIAYSYPYDIITPNLEYRKFSPSRSGVLIKRYTDESLIFAEPDGCVIRYSELRGLIKTWNGIGEYLVSECGRLEKFFDKDGYIMVEPLEAVGAVH